MPFYLHWQKGRPENAPQQLHYETEDEVVAAIRALHPRAIFSAWDAPALGTMERRKAVWAEQREGEATLPLPIAYIVGNSLPLKPGKK